MFGVVINKYGNESVLNYQTDLKTPQLKPNQVMVEVHSSSVNPLDLMKREGYGAIILKNKDKIISWVRLGFLRCCKRNRFTSNKI